VGHGQVEQAVADAGPLIHLHEVEQIDLLSLFKILCIPGAVWAESADKINSPPLNLNNIRHHTLTASDVDHFVQTHSLSNLHVGERESLCLCNQLDIPLLLTDDLAVREAARRLCVRPVGSLGIVVRGYKEGILTYSEAEKSLIALYEESSLFVTQTIVEIAIEQLA